MSIAVIYLLGAIHGVILAFVLAQKKINKLPNRLLAMLMLVFSIDLGMAAFLSLELEQTYPYFIGIDYPVTLLYGPLLYLYVKTLRDGSSSIERIDYLHFLPFAVLLVYMIPFYAGPAAGKLAILENPGSLSETYGFGYINHLKVLHGLTYVGGVFYMILSYRDKLKDSFSSIEKINLNWLLHLITGTIILAVFAGILHLISSLSLENNVLMGMSSGIYDDLTLISATAFVFGIGYMGLHQPEVFAQPVKTDTPKKETNQSAAKNPSNSYQKSGLDEQEAERYSRQLIRVMEEEKLYRNSELKLADLAEKLTISPHNLTEIINRYIGQNFYDFVNSYRIEEVKQRLQDSSSQNITLLAIGLEAGFNSKSTFNAVFKKQTGMTPSQFQKQVADI